MKNILSGISIMTGIYLATISFWLGFLPVFVGLSVISGVRLERAHG